MNTRHEETIRWLVESVKADESILGLILCGSVAKGTETERSDIDLFVVVTDERFAREKAAKNYFWGTDFDSSAFEVEVDGKIIPKDFLEKAWRYGNESIQESLAHAKVVYSRDGKIEEILKIGSLGLDCEKTEKMRKFYALMKSSRYSADGDPDNLLFVHQCIYDTVYYACRLVLADNDIPFPSVKNLSKALEQCKKLPDSFFSLMNDVLDSYSFEKLELFYSCVDQYFKAYHLDNRLRKGYVLENEWFWYFSILPYREI